MGVAWSEAGGRWQSLGRCARPAQAWPLQGGGGDSSRGGDLARTAGWGVEVGQMLLPVKGLGVLPGVWILFQPPPSQLSPMSH